MRSIRIKPSHHTDHLGELVHQALLVLQATRRIDQEEDISTPRPWLAARRRRPGRAASARPTTWRNLAPDRSAHHSQLLDRRGPGRPRGGSDRHLGPTPLEILGGGSCRAWWSCRIRFHADEQNLEGLGPARGSKRPWRGISSAATASARASRTSSSVDDLPKRWAARAWVILAAAAGPRSASTSISSRASSCSWSRGRADETPVSCVPICREVREAIAQSPEPAGAELGHLRGRLRYRGLDAERNGSRRNRVRRSPPRPLCLSAGRPDLLQPGDP